MTVLLESRTVLLVDDQEPVVRAYVGYLSAGAAPACPDASAAADAIAEDSSLGAPGYELLKAASGEEAVRLMRAELAAGRRVTCGFVDLSLPGGIDGVETARQLRALDGDILLALVTGYGDEAAERFGAVFPRDRQEDWEYVVKPFQRAEIVQKCQRMVHCWNRRRRVERSLGLRAGSPGGSPASASAWDDLLRRLVSSHAPAGFGRVAGSALSAAGRQAEAVRAGLERLGGAAGGLTARLGLEPSSTESAEEQGRRAAALRDSAALRDGATSLSQAMGRIARAVSAALGVLGHSARGVAERPVAPPSRAPCSDLAAVADRRSP